MKWIPLLLNACANAPKPLLVSTFTNTKQCGCTKTDTPVYGYAFIAYFRTMRKLMTLHALLCMCMATMAQSGKVLENETVKSRLLNMDRKYAVYLPPDYNNSERHYPVLYLLHGGGDDHTGWVQFGEVLNITDKAIREGTATPMVIIMPDANTGKRGYYNDIEGKWNYEDFFFTELMPEVEKKYRIRKDRRYRAVARL